MIESIAVHIAKGRMTVGYYTVEDGKLQMIGPDGDVIREHILKPGDNVKSLATVFTKEIRNSMVNPFWDDIKHPENGIA